MTRSFVRAVAITSIGALVLAGCTTIKSPLSDVTEDELTAASEHFAPISAELDAAAELLATNPTREAVAEHIATYYDPSVVFEDVSFDDRTEGRDALIEPFYSFITAIGDASIEGQVTVGDPTALQRASYWGFRIGGLKFAEATPFTEVNLLTVDDDLIDTQILFLDLVTLGRVFGSQNPVVDGVLQQGYAAAWSSGEPDRVVALYGTDAIRQDGLAEVEVQGATGIRTEVDRWLEQTDEATWTVRLAFAEASGRRVGAFYDVTVDGCAVEIGILFEVDGDGLITRETIHYGVDSLRACEWIR